MRTDTQSGGICRSTLLPKLVRAAPHHGEEPCISGTRGAGTLFFSGCSLRCVYCQNREISRSSIGKTFTDKTLCDLMLRMQDSGVHNIELVTPTHFTRVIARALEQAKLTIPVVWNSSGYECAETLHILDGLVQVYLPDLKYLSPDTALRYSAARDYPKAATASILEMYRQRGPYHLDEEGLLQSGLLIRHLILPGHAEESMDVIDFVADSFPQGSTLFSLMSQYTPITGLDSFPELCRTVTAQENEDLIHYMKARHLDGYWQELSSVGEESIPLFDGSGLDI